MKKQLIAAGIAATIGVAGVGVGVANAATNVTAGERRTEMVDAIATKFNLDKTQVQQVFDEQRSKMQAEREQEAKDAVAQLVKDGKLTQAQADAINAKRTDMLKEREAEREKHKNMTADERKAEREKHRTELEAWANENNIDTQYLRYVMGGGHGHGQGGHGKFGGRQSS